MIKKLFLDEKSVVQEILRLQIRSYQCEAKIIDFDALPPLSDTIESLQNSQETFYGYFIEEEIVGVISYKILDGTLDIHRLVVSPDRFKKGIASALLKFVEGCEKEISKLIVSTAGKNYPATRLYQKMGFAVVKIETICGNLVIHHFAKKIC